MTSMTKRRQPGGVATASVSPGRFRHILVPTDLTVRTDKALQLAGELSAPAGGRVTLIHVIEEIPGLPLKEVTAFYHRLERKAQKAMDALTSRAHQQAADVSGIAVRGAVAEEIVSYAVGTQVDLIVLASHRVNPSLVGRDWGTLSYKVGILAQCPVLLVK
jgi:universal stress protein A